MEHLASGMALRRAGAVLLLLAALALSAPDGALGQSLSSCPIPNAQLQRTSFRNVQPLCDVREVTGRVSCDECLCALTSTMYEQLTQAGVDVNSLIRSADTDNISSFFSACQAPLALQLMLTSGLGQEAMVQLGECDISRIPARCVQSLQKLAEPKPLPAADPAAAAPAAGAAAAPAAAAAPTGTAAPTGAPAGGGGGSNSTVNTAIGNLGQAAPATAATAVEPAAAAAGTQPATAAPAAAGAAQQPATAAAPVVVASPKAGEAVVAPSSSSAAGSSIRASSSGVVVSAGLAGVMAMLLVGKLLV